MGVRLTKIAERRGGGRKKGGLPGGGGGGRGNGGGGGGVSPALAGGGDPSPPRGGGGVGSGHARKEDRGSAVDALERAVPRRGEKLVAEDQAFGFAGCQALADRGNSVEAGDDFALRCLSEGSIPSNGSWSTFGGID